jgi:hypothetical protein
MDKKMSKEEQMKNACESINARLPDLKAEPMSDNSFSFLSRDTDGCVVRITLTSDDCAHLAEAFLHAATANSDMSAKKIAKGLWL